jgi:F-type H+/Na+-transporting ATPase subunit alpha
VSRVGGNAQTKAMKKVAGRLRLDLAQYRALEAFAEFGSELDKASQQQLARGARVVEVLKQPQYEPVPVERQVVYVYVATGGYLDELLVQDARRFVQEFAEFLDTRHADVLSTIKTSGELNDDTEAALKAALADFTQTFVATQIATAEDVAASRETAVEASEEETPAPAAE